MATALNAAKEHLTCALCKNTFEDPKTLICLHSFCMRCVSEHIVKETKGKSKPKEFSCPVCRKATCLSEFSSKKPNEWASMLPTNDALANILVALNNAENTSSNQCPSHSDKEVEFFCEDHEIFACSICSNEYHKSCRRLNSIEDAVKTRRESMATLTNDLTSQMTETEKLLNNRQDQIDYIESKENEMKEEISTMRKQIDEFFSQMESKIFDAFAEAKHKESDTIQQELNVCYKLQTETENAIDELRKMGPIKNPLNFVQKYNVNLRAYEERQDKLAKLFGSLTDISIKYLANRTIEKTIFEAENLGSLSVERVKSRIAKEITVQQSEKPDTVVTPRETNSRMSIMSQRKQESQASATASTPGIEVARVAPMQKKSVATIGTDPDESFQEDSEEEIVEVVEEVEVPVPPLTLKIDKPKEKEKEAPESPVTVVTARSARDFNAAVEKQYECTIEGAAIFPSGHIALSDSTNKCLKVFDHKYTFLTLVKYSVTPGDLAIFSEKDVVICLPETSRLKHHRVDFKGKKISPGEVLKLEGKCFSVAFNNRKLACCSTSHVYLYKRQGNSWVDEGTINVCVNNLKFVALDNAAERVFVSRDGYPNRSIICMNTTGLRLWAFTHEEIRLPRGLAVHGNRLFVAVSDLKTIVQLNCKTGKYEGVVVQDSSLQWPWKLCISQRGDRMLISQSHSKMVPREKNKVFVYNLSKIQSEDIPLTPKN